MGPRNNYSRLPWSIRSKILSLLHDGAEYEEIRSDKEIAAALSERNLKLHATTFQAIKKSKEYSEYIASAKKHHNTLNAEKVTAALLKNFETVEDMSEVVRYELSRQVRELLTELDYESDAAAKSKILRSLSQSLNVINSQNLERKLVAKESEISALKTLLESEKLRYESEIAELKKTILELNSKLKIQTINEEKLQQIEKDKKLL